LDSRWSRCTSFLWRWALCDRNRYSKFVISALNNFESGNLGCVTRHCLQHFHTFQNLSSAKGKLYTFGSNDWGQLGHGNTKPYSKPSVVKSKYSFISTTWSSLKFVHIKVEMYLKRLTVASWLLRDHDLLLNPIFITVIFLSFVYCLG